MSELSTVISVGGIAALVTLFFNSFKGGYEIRRNMFRVSAMADKNIGKWHRKVLLSMSAKDEQVIVLSITSISGRFLSNTGEIVKRIELNKTLITHSPAWQFVVDYLPDRWETQKVGRIDVFVQAETSMNFRCYFSLQEFQLSEVLKVLSELKQQEQ